MSLNETGVTSRASRQRILIPGTTQRATENSVGMKENTYLEPVYLRFAIQVILLSNYFENVVIGVADGSVKPFTDGVINDVFWILVYVTLYVV